MEKKDISPEILLAFQHIYDNLRDDGKSASQIIKEHIEMCTAAERHYLDRSWAYMEPREKLIQ